MLFLQLHIITRNSNPEQSATDDGEGGIKHSIQGSELPPNSHKRARLTAFPEVNSLTKVLSYAKPFRSLYKVPAGYTAHARSQCKH